jgi:hypothetical protein
MKAQRKEKKMTPIKNFIENIPQDCEIAISGRGVGCDWKYKTRAELVKFDGDSIMFYAPHLKRYVHTDKKSILSYKII